MKILDADTSVEGRMFVLSDDGIYSRELVNSVDYQHLAEANRPEFEWRRMDAPKGVKLTKVIAGTQGELHVISDGQLYRRVRDRGYMSGDKYIWHEVDISNV